MRKKRQTHDKVVQRHKSREFTEENVSLFQQNMYSIQTDLFKKEENSEDEEADLNENNDSVQNFNDQNLVIRVTDNTSRGATKSKTEKRKRDREIIDKEHFIPYKPKNYNQEKSLGINTSFNREVSKATLDLMGDDADELRRNSQKMKWDRKKKKFVSAQSTLDKSKKIKTESGNYINASYKSDLYSKWLKRNEGAVNNDNDDNEENDKKRQNKNKKYFGSEKKYFGSHKFKSTGKPGVKRFKSGGGSSEDFKQRTRRGGKRESSDTKGPDRKRFKEMPSAGGGGAGKKRHNVGLKHKDQIIKERNRKAKIQSFQKKKRGKPGHKSKRF